MWIIKLWKKWWAMKNDVITETNDIKKNPIIPYQPKFRFVRCILIKLENLIPYPIVENKKIYK